MNTRIKLVAIIGASYGAGIAAHLANAGIPVLLLDVVPLLARWRRDRSARNVVVQRGYDAMANANPPQLVRHDLIMLGTLDDDSAKLADCDWIIDAMVQPMIFNLLPLWMQNIGLMFFFILAWMRPDRKPPQSAPNRALMNRIEAARNANCIVSSTTGAPVHQIIKGRSLAFRRYFLGMQFSTPARYVKLLEMTPTADTAAEVVEFMVDFCRDRLGKGVVFSKDTPSYINNRMLTMTNTYDVETALDQGCSVEEVDALTGPLIGRPEFATFQLMDTVTIGVLAFLITNLYPTIADDPYRPVLNGKKYTKVRNRMLRNGWLGRETGRTFYLTRMVKGQSEIEAVLDPTTFRYAPPQVVHLPSADATKQIEELDERLRALLTYNDRGATYVRSLLDFDMLYAAEVAPTIAGTLADIDAAICWGFDRDAGPFQIWDMLGVAETTQRIEAAGEKVAGWVHEMLAAGHTTFYQDGAVYDYVTKSYRPLPVDPKILRVETLRQAGKELACNEFARLLDMDDGIALLEFHYHPTSWRLANSIDGGTVAMAEIALQRLASDFDALVIGNDGRNYSLGANLPTVLKAIEEGTLDALAATILSIADVTLRLRYAGKPIVSAPHGVTVGAGLVFAMSSWQSTAAFETYMGLAEAALGVIPAGGGCKETLRVRVNPAARTPGSDISAAVRAAFAQLADSTISMSALEAQPLGYLQPLDPILMNDDYVLAAAKTQALTLARNGANPPQPEQIYVAGRDQLAALELEIERKMSEGTISQFDAVIQRKLAYIVCGGDLPAPAWVEPKHIFDLETEAFLSLLGEAKTQARLTHFLATGKLLRN